MEIVVKIAGQECAPYSEVEFIGLPSEPKYWHKIVAVSHDSTDYECELLSGIRVIIRALHGTELHKGFSSVAPSVKSPFTLELKP